MALVVGLVTAIVLASTVSVIGVLVVRQHTTGSSSSSATAITGPSGARGAQGMQGPTGLNTQTTGPTGIPGPTGISSDQTGVTGYRGATGASGSNGGVSTVTGPTGFAGFSITGPTGLTGASGPSPPSSISDRVTTCTYYFLDTVSGQYYPASPTGAVLTGDVFLGGPTYYRLSVTGLPKGPTGAPLVMRFVSVPTGAAAFPTGTTAIIGEANNVFYPSYSKLVISRSLVTPTDFDMGFVDFTGVFTPLTANNLGAAGADLTFSFITP